MTDWIENWNEDSLDPQDGQEPFCFWWDDMRPKEVNALVREAYERGKASATDAVREQARPTGDGQRVLDKVFDDLKAREKVGIERYGTPLKTNNGRDPLVDAYQEGLDLVQYMAQELLEREQLRAKLAEIEAHERSLCKEVSTLRGEIADLRASSKEDLEAVIRQRKNANAAVVIAQEILAKVAATAKLGLQHGDCRDRLSSIWDQVGCYHKEET